MTEKKDMSNLSENKTNISNDDDEVFVQICVDKNENTISDKDSRNCSTPEGTLGSTPVLKQTSCHSWISSYFSRFLMNASKYLGIILATGSGLFSTVYSSLYKMVKNDIDNSTILILRGVIQVVIMIVILCVKRSHILPVNMEQKSTWRKAKTWIIFVLVLIIGGLRLCFIFAALERIPMALVHTILNGSPVVVMVLGHFFLKDFCNVLRTVCTFGLVAGVILIFQPHSLLIGNKESDIGNSTQNLTESQYLTNTVTNCSYNESISTFCNDGITDQVSDDLVGYAFCVSALVTVALGSVLTKMITKHFDKMVIVLYLGISIGIVGWLQFMIFEPKAPTFPTTYMPWIMATIVGFFGLAQQLCLIAALQIESTTRVSVIQSLQIVLSFIVQVLAWNEHPGIDQIFGALIVVLAICLVTFEDNITQHVNSYKQGSGCDCCFSVPKKVEPVPEQESVDSEGSIP